MTELQQEYLNDFFVHLFNKIMSLEDRALTQVGEQDLSVKELHVLEAVYVQTQQGRNTMTAVAGALSIRVSSLTAAVNTLVRKGYLVRSTGPDDRRVIHIRLTPRGEEANRRHSQFHREMIDGVSRRLSDTELEILTGSLRQLDQFFNEMASPSSSCSNEKGAY